MKLNPAVDQQDVALEVPGGDLVDLDLFENSLYRFVLKNWTLNINIVRFDRYFIFLVCFIGMPFSASMVGFRMQI